jgi:Xaa-Pro aminopeptidase
VLVEEREIAGAEGRYFGFENLTWAPIDKTLVDTSLLGRDELRWWDAYHARVLEIVGPQVEGDALAWVTEACAGLGKVGG